MSPTKPPGRPSNNRDEARARLRRGKSNLAGTKPSGQSRSSHSSYAPNTGRPVKPHRSDNNSLPTARSRAIASQDPREVALQCLSEVLTKEQPLEPIFEVRAKSLSARDRSLARALTSGTLRHYFSLRLDLARFCSRPLDELQANVLHALLLGAFQLRHTRVPPYAAVGTLVDLVPKPAGALVNAVLRKVSSEPKPESEDEQVVFEHPAWLISTLRTSYPDHWRELLNANVEPPPLCLRIDTQRISIGEYQQLLHAMNIESHAGRLAPTALYLPKPVERSVLPGIDEGLATIQDEGAQLVVEWMDANKVTRVLDACAAPGNKTSHLLDTAPDARITALDRNQRRKDHLQRNLARYTREVKVICADATEVNRWWDGIPFDRILVDAPCTATGTIRRHPEIKLLRESTRIEEFARQQLNLLRALWPCLKQKGLLVYSTCSLLPAENGEIIAAFLDEAVDAVLDLPSHDYGLQSPLGTQLLPRAGGPDGFFLARLRKTKQDRGQS